MLRLEKSEKLGRIIRQDDVVELAIPTWTLVREAVRAEKIDEALKLIDYGCSENKLTCDMMVSNVDDTLTLLATFGEEEIYKHLRKRYYPIKSRFLSEMPSVEECIQTSVEYQRAFGGNFTITEEPDRYVVRCAPCGSGGQLRRTKDAGAVKKAYAWTWGKSGVPYYCLHCCVSWEILPTEIRGYPIRINIIGDKPEDPCIHYFYKKPELIPEEYFTRIGMTKTIN